MKINDSGKILNAKVTKGIGHGCDEEALRLAYMLKYGGVKNRGVRVMATKKVRIAFKLSEHRNIKYEFKKTENKKTISDKNTKDDTNNTTFGYTINF